MNDESKQLAKTIENALSGKGAHVGTKDLFQGLDWKVAGTRPEGAPSPANAKEWQRAVRGFRSGLARLARQARESSLLTKRGKHSRLRMLQAIASHNSYHAGQVVVLRQMLGKWPPPSGGLTW